MPYCSHALVITPDADLAQIISTLAQEQFNALSAHVLDNGEYNIDGGLNDVRARVDISTRHVRFFCRYENDVHRTDEKVSNFAQNHQELCQLAK